MLVDRRQLLGAASLIALFSARPVLSAPLPLVAMAATGTSAPSQRSVLNIGFVSGGGNEYSFINHFRNAEQFGPTSGWTTGPTWMQSIASDGYPNVSIKVTDNKSFGGGIRIPASFQYGDGPTQSYVLRWKGNGEVRLMLQAGSWTYQSSKSKNATVVGSDRWKTTSGADSYIVLNFSGPAQLLSVNVFASDPNGTGARLRDLQFYRLEDEADLLAGLVFRKPFKQSIVDYCPSAIRFMNWVGGNNAKLCRFESRTRPDYAVAGNNWVASPPYGETSGVNQFTLAAVSGTPRSAQHGEVVTCRMGAGQARCGAKTVRSITNSSPARVNAPGHGLNTGDTVIHQMANGVMPRLNLLPCQVTVVDPDNYVINVDTTKFGVFSGNATVTQFVTLNVGGRGGYPIVFPIPSIMASNYGANYIAKGDYKTFIFDKTVSMQTDGNGNYVYGVWMFNDLGANNAHAGGVPLEVCTALVNEVNAMKVPRPVGMWMNIPHLGLSSMDPDYAVTSDWGIQAVNTVINGTAGYAGLVASAPLLVEYSNETWNSGGMAFAQNYYLAYRGFLRWPASGTSDYASMAALRSVVMVEDIKQTAAGARVKFVLAGQGTLGVSGLNAARIDGTKFFLTDPLNKWGAAVSPMMHHDYFAFGGYFVAQNSFDTSQLANLTNAWVSSLGYSALEEAACSSYVSGIVNPAIGGNETVDRYKTLLAAYAARMKSLGKYAIMYEGGWDHDVKAVSSAYSVTATNPYARGAIDGKTNLITNVSSDYIAALAPGYFIVGYGIPKNARVLSISGNTITISQNTTAVLSSAQFIAFTPQQMFLLAVKRSQAWATAIMSYLAQFGSASGSGMPADYVASDLRWGHTFPSAYGASNKEWADVDVCWQQQASRNRSLV